MRITELLSEQGVALHFQAADKAQAVDELVERMDSLGVLADKAAYKAQILAREEEGTTGIGEGVAIPHAKVAAVKRAALVAAVSRDGVDYDSLDGEPTHLFFMIAAPEEAKNFHLDLLGRLSVLLMDEGFRQKLIDAPTPAEFLRIIDEADEEKAEGEAPSPAPAAGYQIVAVTACPTGIAHTYMAAEGLEQKAAELGVSIKVETNGSGGAKNVLTPEEIAGAKGVIVAADTQVAMERFDGKRVVQTRVADGISKPGELIAAVLEEKAPLYRAQGGGQQPSRSQGREGAGHAIYKHLMNGVSHMLPFVIGGGILIALAFLADTLLAPGADPANFGKNSQLANFLKTVGEAAFGFMLPILAGYIASSIADRPGLAVGFVGGALASAGGSGFLGALIAGFAAGYLVLLLKWLCDKLPASLEGLKPVLLYPLFGILGIGAVITFVVNPPVSALNAAISNGLINMGEASGILLGVVLAAMMAIDMGGPFNKAAYVFGTASLLTAGGASISSGPMAAVMIGGMVPPLAIALCSTFFKNRFTAKERQSGLTNYIMGLSFITEGAIPFAAADPLRVIPACAIGSAVAGGLSMFFGCTLPAPHGGIFVIPVVHNWPMYLLALAIGSAVSTLLLALLKKPVGED